MNNLHLAFGTDRNNLVGLAVTARTAIDACSLPCTIHVLAIDLTKNDKERLKASWPKAAVHFIDIDRYSLDGFRPTMYLRSKVPYIRYFLGETLPKDVSRCLWLDTDMLIRSDLAPLQTLDLQGHTIGAVTDVSAQTNHLRAARLKNLGIDQPERYFNSGFLLIDLNAWREKEMDKCLAAFTRKHYDTLDAQDQDALNALLHHEWYLLDAIWNQSQYKQDLVEDQGVIHLIGKKKPWHADYDYRYRLPFFDVLDQTAYKGWRPSNPFGLGSLLKRFERLLPSPEIILGKVRRVLGEKKSGQVE